MTVGRDSSSDLIVRNVGISRKHAVIREEPEPGRFTITDLKSTNGVQVNGNAYGKIELRHGDYVDFGQVRFRFVGPGEDFVFSRDVQVTVVRRKASRHIPRRPTLTKTTKKPKRI
jgi:pSer/pThr/pTyr-binding forkhead associated (FHA) protein